jgi:hypothetical protein
MTTRLHVAKKSYVSLVVKPSEGCGLVSIGVDGEDVAFVLTRTMARSIANALDDDVDVTFAWEVGEGVSVHRAIVKVTAKRGMRRWHELVLMSEYVSECHLELDAYDTDMLRDALLTFLEEESTDGRPAVVTVDKEVSE